MRALDILDSVRFGNHPKKLFQSAGMGMFVCRIEVVVRSQKYSLSILANLPPANKGTCS